MTDAVYWTAILARLVHLGSACLLTGIFAFLVFVARPAVRAAGPAAREAFRVLDRRLLALGAIALVAAVATGLIDLARQALVAGGGRIGEGLAIQTIGTLLVATRYGDVWLARQALWLLLAALLILRGPEGDESDWLGLRLAGLTLSGAALAFGAASGHAASAPEFIARAIGADALHLLAAGIWAGALVPLVLFLRWARPGSRDAPPAIAAVVAVRRFSTLGLLSVTVILASGVYAIPQQVGGIPALLGTTYGRWLSLKLGLFLLLLGVAFFNRAYLRPRLERAAADRPGRTGDAAALVTRLGRSVTLEALLVATILGAVAVLGLTAPARHDPIAWPLPFRFSWETTRDLLEPWTRVAVGGQLAIVGVLASVLAAALDRRWRRSVLIGGAGVLCLGLALALPPLTVDAYPTTYVRPTVAYTAASIVRGHGLYRDRCESCHGPDGAGDGAAGITPRPPDLTGSRTAEHTAGDLFWWLTHGVRGSAGHGFADRLSSDQRWDLVNLLRTFSGGRAARGLGPVATPTSTIAGPDFGYTVGVGAERSLRDYRGQTIVLLVFFRLPESLGRLSRLAGVYFDFRTRGAEILAVPLEGAGTVYRTLGPRPILFPFAIGGAGDAAAAYSLFARDLPREGRRPDPPPPVHMEVLVDRQGYLRARWLPRASPDAAGGWSDPMALLGEVDRLAREPASSPVLGEHIH